MPMLGIIRKLPESNIPGEPGSELNARSSPPLRTTGLSEYLKKSVDYHPPYGPYLILFFKIPHQQIVTKIVHFSPSIPHRLLHQYSHLNFYALMFLFIVLSFSPLSVFCC